MPVKIAHGRYLKEMLTFVYLSNVSQIEFQDGTCCMILGTLLNKPLTALKQFIPPK